jgi:hypothetical protein
MERVTVRQGRWIASGLYLLPEAVSFIYLGAEGVVWSFLLALLAIEAMCRLTGGRRLLALGGLCLLYSGYPSLFAEFAQTVIVALTAHDALSVAAVVASARDGLPLLIVRAGWFALVSGALVLVPLAWAALRRDGRGTGADRT